MTVLYIILGIIIGVPVYLLLNTLLALLARPFMAVSACFYPIMGTSFMNEIKSGDGSLMDFYRNFFALAGWFIFIMMLCFFITSLIYGFLWLVYHFFRFWFKIIIIKICWNLGRKTKTKTETK